MTGDSLRGLDPLFPLLQEALPSPDGPDPSLSAAAEGEVDAAVSLILRAGPELELLLIRRAEVEGDPWSGQMALPGGRWDPSDPHLLQTAMRETLEETGVRLEENGLPLGRMERVAPATHRLPPISIHPFVFGVPPGTLAQAASREVDEIIWTPLSVFWDPAASGEVDIPLGDQSRIFPCFRVKDRAVWGLTYRIISGFLEMVPRLPPTRQ
jgi:8-oxo-dGTP pyrophosphatase MutT (NUDIX family)